MNLGEIKDVVREHFGRIGWPTAMLDEALRSARRDVEKSGNFYWMRDTLDFDTAADQVSYPIVETATEPAPDDEELVIPAFKDFRSLNVREDDESAWLPVELGTMTQEQADLMFPPSAGSLPLVAVLDNRTLLVYPKPDKIYEARLFFYKWTDNPAGNLESDELTQRFPEALIYGALVWGCEQFEKSYEDAMRWRQLFELENAKIHRHSLERERQDRLTLVPMLGPNTRHHSSRYARRYWGS